MKKVSVFTFVLISFFVLVGASIWEGAAEYGGDLPETGLYIATNSLPINTVVDVTNLENGRSTQLVVSSGLNKSGFLAQLSKDAANRLGIEKGSLSRIRLSQNPDPLAFSSFIVDPGTMSEYEDYILVPERPRPPEGGGPVLDPSQFITGYTPPQASSELSFDPSLVIEPVRVIPDAAHVSVFSAPMISVMERGMYYVQVAAYSNPESVEYELTRRIDRSLPVAIMEARNADKLVYRILIGPLDFTESSAVMERYKGVYQDAFVWQGR